MPRAKSGAEGVAVAQETGPQCEETQLQELSHHFSDLMRDVQSLRDQLAEFGPCLLLTQIRRLEEKILATQNMSVAQIQSLLGKLQVQDVGAVEKSDEVALDFKQRVKELNSLLFAKELDMRTLQLLLAQKDKEIEIRNALTHPSRTEVDREECLLLLQEAQERYEEEHYRRLQLEEDLQHLRLILEEQKSLSQPSVPSHLAKDEQMHGNRAAGEEYRPLEKAEELRSEAAALESTLASEEASNRELIESLGQQRLRDQWRIRALEARLQEMQDLLLAKEKHRSDSLEGESPLKTVQDEGEDLNPAEDHNWTVGGEPLDGLSPAAGHSLSSSKVKALRSVTSVPPGRPATATGAHSSRLRRETGEFSESLNPRRPVSVPPFLDGHSALLGQGRDYFSCLFKKEAAPSGASVEENRRSSAQESSIGNSSATGYIQIAEVHPNGLYVRLVNSSQKQEEDIGGFLLQQNVGGHPVTVFRFPHRTRLKAAASVTVWAAASKVSHKPPEDFLWKEQHRFGTGPECTTILCKPNGQAVAWYTPVRWSAKSPHAWQDRGFDSEGQSRSPLAVRCEQENPSEDRLEKEEQGRPSQDLRAERAESQGPYSNKREEEPHSLLKRTKEAAMSLPPTRSPWTQSPSSSTHPDWTEVVRPGSRGQNRRLCRPAWSQSATGSWADWSSSSRRGPGSSVLLDRGSRGPTRSAGGRLNTLRFHLPGSFCSPGWQHSAGLQLLQSAHNLSFQPPLPRPPPVASW
uniref:Lamin tail domain containing 1 n=1 Tax=Lepisosteus oculatus TaxID=7918 RepID=W5NE06_LEPOC|nr:PREDICTED: lamin tail domain-containing protein 1 isoform X2 [Lepisosteus oculatus]